MRCPGLLLRLFVTVVLFNCITSAHAQLCSGSFGDPAVNITFGTVGGATPYVPSNAYIYTGSQCPDDGAYTITGTTVGCFNSTWHSVVQDHTGGGAFMLVNASYEPGDFFLTTVTDLCPNTTYQFAAWVMNVLNRNGIRPNLTFSIEAKNGTILGQYSTGDIIESFEPVWKQYGLYFTTPADNAVIVLRITNNAPGGLGNDLALDDITFSPCGPAITTVIEGNPDTVNICTGFTSTYTFNSTVSNGFSFPVYQWQTSIDSGLSWQDIPGASTLAYTKTFSATGFYWYRLAVTEKTSANILSCRVASNVVAVNVHDNPQVNAGPDRISIAGIPVALLGSVAGELPAYYWSPPVYLDNDSLLTPLSSPPSGIINYTLYATSKYGCKNNDATQVKVVAGIFVPNAFTPNNDGKNDNWRIPFLDPLLNATVNVYNRFGQLVYHAKSKIVDWDGTVNGYQQPAGIYVYSITFKETYPQLKGTVLLIR